MMSSGRDPYRDQWKRIEGEFKRISARIDDHEKRTRAAFNALAAKGNGMSDMYERAAAANRAYAQVVILLGYGGFFTLWSSVSGKMPVGWFAASGVLICLSLFVFVMHELAKTYLMTRIDTRAELKAGEGPIDLPQWKKDTAKAGLTLSKIWGPCFIVSAATGLTAGAILLFWFVQNAVTEASQAKADQEVSASISADTRNPDRTQVARDAMDAAADAQAAVAEVMAITAAKERAAKEAEQAVDAAIRRTNARAEEEPAE